MSLGNNGYLPVNTNTLINNNENKLNPLIKDGIDHEYQCPNCGRYYRTEIKRCICGVEFTQATEKRKVICANSILTRERLRNILLNKTE